MHRFEAVVQLTGKTATFIEVPFDVPAVFGRVRAPVRGTINSSPFRSTIMRYGETYFLPVNRSVREGAKAAAGDSVAVTLERDDEPRVVKAPADFARALAQDARAKRAFERLSYSHRKEYVDWIIEGKRDETRRRRIEKAVAMLREGKTQR